MFELDRRAIETPVVKRTQAWKIQQLWQLLSRKFHGRRDRKLNYILKTFFTVCFHVEVTKPIGANNYLGSSIYGE